MSLDPLEITGGLAIGEGLGGAIADTVEPRLQNFKNSQWRAHPDKPLSVGEAVRAALKNVPTNLDLADEALQSGFGADVFATMQENEREYPGTAELLELWRRGKLSQADVDAALTRQMFDPTYRAALMELFNNPLDPAVIATAIQRGIMTDPGFLPVGPPTGEGNVKAFPVSPLDPLNEAQWSGVNEQRLFVETAIVGLPLALIESAHGYFRGILTLDDFKRAVAEGNTRNEWGDAALEVAREILTASQYAELQLRGYITADERRGFTAQHGMTAANSDLLYDVIGRGVNVHQVLIGERRGGVYKPSPATFAEQIAGIPEEYVAALERGNLRPEYYNLAYAARETYPSYFVTKALLTANVITAERGAELFSGLGWPEDVAQAAGTAFGTTTAATAKADPWVTKADTQLWAATHKAYVGGAISQPEATTALNLIGITPASQTAVYARWDAIKVIEATPAP